MIDDKYICLFKVKCALLPTWRRLSLIGILWTKITLSFCFSSYLPAQVYSDLLNFFLRRYLNWQRFCFWCSKLLLLLLLQLVETIYGAAWVRGMATQALDANELKPGGQKHMKDSRTSPLKFITRTSSRWVWRKVSSPHLLFVPSDK